MYAKATGPGGHSKAFWKILKQNFGNTANDSIPMLIDGPTNCISDVSKATLLNKYFVEQSTLDLSNEPQLSEFLPHRDLKSNVHIDLVACSSSKVFFILQSLDVNKATDPDGFGNTVLKFCASALCAPLSYIFQIYLNLGRFPNIMEKSPRSTIV